MDRGAWKATVHGAAKSQTRLSSYHLHIITCLDRSRKEAAFKSCPNSSVEGALSNVQHN